MSPKTAVKYPRVVATMTKEETKKLAALTQDDEAVMAAMFGGGDVPFEELAEKHQDMKRDFWHGLYKAHKLDPQRDYNINPENGEITQLSGQKDLDTI